MPDHSQLNISDTLSLPLDATTRTFGILAQRGMGKTYAAAVMAEEMLLAEQQVVVLDPLDGWWGLRASADGKSGGGLPIYVFGGEHADIALEPSGGALVADTVVEHGISVVLSLRHLSKAAQRRFVAEFAERLYHRKGEVAHRTPLHIFLDEADAFVPQRVVGDVARTMGAVDDLVRRGRSSGIGVTLISQRSAAINKDVLSEIEVLVALRTLGPQDRKALDAWVEAHDAHGQRAEFMGSLASLPVGVAWVWSPGWLQLFERVHIRQRRTFDSSATPTAGTPVFQPAALAPVDLERLSTRMAETIERAKADDPRELRRHIAELERRAGTQGASQEEVDAQVKPLQAQLAGAKRELQRVTALLQGTHSILADLVSRIGVPTEDDGAATPATPPNQPVVQVRSNPAPEPPGADNGEPLRRGELRILEELVKRHPAVWTKTQLGTLTHFAHTGGTFVQYLSHLRRLGLAAVNGRDVGATPLALKILDGKVPTVPTTHDEIMAMWNQSLRSGAYRMLEVAVAHGAQGVDRAALAESAGFTASGGTFGNYLGILKRNGLIEVDGPIVRATQILWP